MFAFHKPKIYRSVNGCCICKAKSSSSRFTDSKKYEPEFERCFRINERRTGEICNACVLLVKRWKKLPAGTNRDWHHVVDVREKSVNKKPKAKTRAKRVVKKLKTKVIVDNMREQLRHQLRHTSGGLSDDVTVGDDSCSDECSNFSPPQSRIPSPELSDADSDDSGIDDKDEEDDDDVETRKKLKRKRKNTSNNKRSSSGNTSPSSGRRKRFKTNKKSNAVDITPVIDLSFWKEEKICCGVIYRGPNGEVLICPPLLKPCKCRLQSQSSTTSSSTTISEEELSEPGDGGLIGVGPSTMTNFVTTTTTTTTTCLDAEKSQQQIHSK